MLGPFVLIVFWANPRSTARDESAFEVHDGAGRSDPGFAAERLAALHTATQRRQLRLRLRLIHMPQPRRRPGQRPLAQRRTIGNSPTRGQTPPKPLFGPTHQSRSKCITLHIAADRPIMVILRNGKRFVSALIQRPAADVSVMGMPALRVRERQPVNEIRKFAVGPRKKSKV